MKNKPISIWEMYEQYYEYVTELFYEDKFSDEYYKAVENMKNLLVACESLEHVSNIMELEDIISSLDSGVSTMEIDMSKSIIQSSQGVETQSSQLDKQQSEIITDMAIEHYNNAIEQARRVIKRDINIIRTMTQKEALEYIEQLLLGGN